MRSRHGAGAALTAFRFTRTTPSSPPWNSWRNQRRSHNIGAVLVMRDGKLAGIFSERDYARKIILLGKSSKETLVREIMTEKVLYALPEQTIDEAMALMTDKHIRHLPVLDANKSVIGMVSIGDLVKETISEQAFLIKQLEQYIAS
jgi:CBS domain-containing protein